MNEDNERLALLKESFEGIPIVRKGEYHYFIHPLSDGLRRIDPDLLMEVTDYIVDILKDSEGIDLLLTAEAMGIPVTTSVSLRSGIPFSIVRKRSYGLEGEVKVVQKTGYSMTDLHINLPPGGGGLVIIDDVLSTGGTLSSVVKGARSAGWVPLAAVILFNKMGEKKQELMSELGLNIITLLDVEFMDGHFIAR